MEGRKQKRKILKRLLRLYVLLALAVVGAYGIIAAFHPGLFAYNLRSLSQALADDTITVSATVLDVPQTPVVTAVAICNSAGVLSVSLEWGADPNSYTYDVSRDSVPVATGLSATAYTDQTVTLGTSYSYQVRANGPMGPGYADSAPVSVTTPNDCAAVLPAPAVQITSFNGEAIAGLPESPQSLKRKPLFTGTSNIPHARLRFVVYPGSPVVAESVANAGGYWEWAPPINLAYGTHTLTVTATDPEDAGRQAMDAFTFRISRPEGQEEEDEASDPAGGLPGSPANLQGLEADFALTVGMGTSQAFFQGESIPFTLRVLALSQQYQEIGLPIRFSLVDESGETVMTMMRTELLRPGRVIEGALLAPLYIKPGRYSLRAEVMLGNINVSRSVPLDIQALPLIRLGSDRVITYDEFMQHIGWFVFISLLLLIVWLFSLLWEYALAMQGYGSVDERDVEKAGYLTRRS